MKKNKKTVNHRNTNKRKNTQHWNPKTKMWVEQNLRTGKFVDNKTSNKKPFKKVRKKK